MEVNKITGGVVKSAATKMKGGKSDVSGSFTSDVILHAPDSFFEVIAAVFRSFLTHGTVSRQLLACAFLPLLKSSLKDPSSTESYRAIAGSSQILKLFDYTVLLLWGHHLASDSLQFGFKSGYSTTQCSWLVMEVAGYYLRNGTPIIATCCDCSRAFDKCRFDLLFEKIVASGVPAIVVRCLIFIYEEQVAWVKWGNVKSREFGIKNSTRQGAILSPIFWCLYCNELIQELRRKGAGCHYAGRWVGATMYADDLLLMAPTRSAMASMLKTCEEFAWRHNIGFSTHPDPKQSKTKCLYMCGNVNVRTYPAPLTLDGHCLPFVTTATHLGHELCQDCTMDQDSKIKRAQYIDRSTDVREMFGFANPAQVLSAIETYCGDHYGAMNWNLYGESFGRYVRCWNTCVKLVWNVPRSTHTYFVSALARGAPSIRTKILSRYVKYFQSLLASDCPEVALVANLAGRDRSSTTGINIYKLRKETGLNPWVTSPAEVRSVLMERELEVPQVEQWRIPLLGKLLQQRHELDLSVEDTSQINELIESLCSS